MRALPSRTARAYSPTTAVAPLVAVACVVVCVALTPRSAGAGPAPARCGMIVGDSVMLDRDLECDRTGLVLRNPRSIVQLNGHTIRFTRRCDEQSPAGVVVEATAQGAEIFGPGAIRGFATGVAVDGAPRVQLHDFAVSENCVRGLGIARADGLEARNLLLRKNGTIPADRGSAVDVEDTATLTLADSTIFLNGAGTRSATVDLHRCDECRVTGNRIVANHGAGLRLDPESHTCEVQRNVILDHDVVDVVDRGSDNAFALNAFERSDGVSPPALWPLLGPSSAPIAGVAGCGTMHAPIRPGETLTLTCPQDPGLRGLRNSVVSYRLLNPFSPALPFNAACDPADVIAATSGGGGALRCRNSDPIWQLILEITCCLN